MSARKEILAHLARPVEFTDTHRQLRVVRKQSGTVVCVLKDGVIRVPQTGLVAKVEASAYTVIQ